MFGNRGGCLHTPAKRLSRRRWVTRRWITCVLEFRGRHREVMAPRRYTELFFLDEATAFAAGHRPCMECRRGDANRFIEAWSTIHLPAGQRLRTVDQIDDLAHPQRIDTATRHQHVSRAQLLALPDGVFVTLDEAPQQPLLLWRDRLHPWAYSGYARPISLPHDQPVTLLTPPSFAACFAAGYTPVVHSSAGS